MTCTSASQQQETQAEEGGKNRFSPPPGDSCFPLLPAPPLSPAYDKAYAHMWARAAAKTPTEKGGVFLPRSPLYPYPPLQYIPLYLEPVFFHEPVAGKPLLLVGEENIASRPGLAQNTAASPPTGAVPGKNPDPDRRCVTFGSQIPGMLCHDKRPVPALPGSLLPSGQILLPFLPGLSS